MRRATASPSTESTVKMPQVASAAPRPRPVALDIVQRLPATLELTFAALALSILLGVPLGGEETLHRRNEEIIVKKLASFDIPAQIIGRNAGPVVTQYEVQPAPHVKVSRIEGLADDLAMALAARSLRIEAPKLPRALPKSLTEADVESLLAAPAVDDALGLRDRAMLEREGVDAIFHPGVEEMYPEPAEAGVPERGRVAAQQQTVGGEGEIGDGAVVGGDDEAAAERAVELAHEREHFARRLPV